MKFETRVQLRRLLVWVLGICSIASTWQIGWAQTDPPPTVELIERARPDTTRFTLTSDYLLTGDNGYLQRLDWRNKQLVGPRMRVNGISDSLFLILTGDLRFSRDGRFMASCRLRKDNITGSIKGGEPMLAQVWDMDTGATVVQLPRAVPLENCITLDFSPDGKVMAVSVQIVRGGNAVRFFETTNWTEIRRRDFVEVEDIHLHNHLYYSPDGKQIVVWSSNGVDSESWKAYRRIGFTFKDHRIEAIVLNAEDGNVLARKVLHWIPSRISGDTVGGFDASGDRIISSEPHGGALEGTEKDIYTNCPTFHPKSIPDGFDAMDLCRKHKAVQVWHWRTGKVDTVYEYPTHVRVDEAVESPEQRLWTYIFEPQFTADGRYLALIRRVEDKADRSTWTRSNSPPSIATLEIRDAQTYQVLLTKQLADKFHKVGGPLQVSPDGRFLAITIYVNQRFNFDSTNYLYEIHSK